MSHGSEQIGQQPAQDQPDHDVWVFQTEIEGHALEEAELIRRCIGDKVGQILRIRSEQHQRAETGGADGIALGHCLGGVPDRIKRVGRLAYFLIHLGHFGDTAGVIGDGPVSVERNDHSGKRQHGRHRNGNAEQRCEVIGNDDPGHDDDRGNRRCLHRHSEALDHIGAMPGFGRGRNAAHGAIFCRGIIFRNPDQKTGHHQPDNTAEKQAPSRELGSADVIDSVHPHGELGNRPERKGGQNRRDDKALVERAHDIVVRPQLDKEGADDGSDNAHPANHQRIGHHRRITREIDGRQNHGGHHRHGIGFEQIGGHTGTVAHIVPYVIGNHRRVAGIIFGDTRLDLTDQIGAHIGALGENATAQTGEDGDQRRAQAESHKAVNNAAPRHTDRQQIPVVARHRKQSETNHQKPGDCACHERNVEAFFQAFRRRRRRPHIGAHRHIHTNEARRAGKNGANGKADGHI